MKKKGKLSSLLLLLAFVAGIGLLAYPTVANYWNSRHQTKAITGYVEQVAELQEDDCSELWEAAAEYNRSLLQRSNSYLLTPEQTEQYNALLDIGGTGIMGYIEIPSIEVTLPIYHGTDSAVLQIAAGHLEWSSLPVGGESTHCVLSGHRGLPSAKLFTDLDRLVEGDVFTLSVMDEILSYEIDRILIVEPEDTDELLIVPGQDLCTLITCTPHGINSHRILVRGHRIANIEQAAAIRITADAIQVEPLIVAPLLALPLLLLFIAGLLISDKFRNKRGEKHEKKI